MQANKSRISPVSATPNNTSKAARGDADSIAGTNQPKKSSHRSQRENEQQSLHRNTVLEKRRPSQFTHLESQLGELQEELKRTKDQLVVSESCRNRAQQEAEEAKMQLLICSSKLEDSQRQLTELSAAEEDRIHELRKLSQERDRAWQSELTALQNQQSMDMAAWSSAIKECQKLKSEIEMLVKSEAAMAKQLEISNSELQAIKEEVLEKNCVIERLKAQFGLPFSSSIELAGSNFMEEQVNDQLRSYSDAKLMDNVESLSSGRESELESELKEAMAEIMHLKYKLGNKDVDIRAISDMNKKLNDEIRAQVNLMETEFSSKNAQTAIETSELMAEIADKNAAIEKLLDENCQLKLEMEKKERDGMNGCEAELEAELRRVKLHSNQWRKAAEIASAIAMAGSHGKIIERSGLIDSQYFYDGRNMMQSPNLDEIDGGPSRSKNQSVLTMISGLWKKT